MQGFAIGSCISRVIKTDIYRQMNHANVISFFSLNDQNPPISVVSLIYKFLYIYICASCNCDNRGYAISTNIAYQILKKRYIVRFLPII